MNIDKMSFAQLRRLADEMSVRNWSRLRKAELREVMRELSVTVHSLELEVQN